MIVLWELAKAWVLQLALRLLKSVWSLREIAL
jgi:hypothetical protein